jgi:hypothetical protein
VTATLLFVVSFNKVIKVVLDLHIYFFERMLDLYIKVVYLLNLFDKLVRKWGGGERKLYSRTDHMLAFHPRRCKRSCHFSFLK